jgi:hypothetical protein
MFRKLFAGFALNQMDRTNAGANTVDLVSDNICIALWPVPNAPTEGNIDSNTIVTVADLATATGGAIHDPTNAFVDINPKVILARQLNLFTISTLTITDAADSGGVLMDFLLMKRTGIDPSAGGPLIGYYPAGINPDGVTDIDIDLSNGVLRYGEV